MNTLLVVFNSPTSMNSMNVFEIGTNKKYFDEGKNKHALTNELVPSINKAIDVLSKVKQPVNLLVCGRTLSWLKSNSQETVMRLKDFIRHSKVKLMTTPYHNSLPETLSGEEFSHQLKLHLKTLKSTLGKNSTTLVLKESFSEEQKVLAQKLGIRNSLILPSLETNNFDCGENSVTVISNTTFQTQSESELLEVLEKNTFSNLDKKFISKLNWNKLMHKRNELHHHVHSEVSNFYPLLKKLNDEQSLNDWRLISASINLNDNNRYDNYLSIMNTLNDISFKVQNIELLKQGKDIVKPTITNNPSELLKNIFDGGQR